VRIITDQFTGRPRGFGFVEMATKEEATKAVDMLNGRLFRDRNLVVDEARPQPQRGGGGDRGGSRGPRPGGGGGGGGWRRWGTPRGARPPSGVRRSPSLAPHVFPPPHSLRSPAPARRRRARSSRSEQAELGIGGGVGVAGVAAEAVGLGEGTEALP